MASMNEKKYFELVDEKKDLESITNKMFNLEKELVWYDNELEKIIEEKRFETYSRIAKIEKELKEMREGKTREFLKEVRKRYMTYKKVM